MTVTPDINDHACEDDLHLDSLINRLETHEQPHAHQDIEPTQELPQEEDEETQKQPQRPADEEMLDEDQQERERISRHAALQSVVMDNKGGGDVAPTMCEHVNPGTTDVFLLACAAPPIHARQQFKQAGEDEDNIAFADFVAEKMQIFIGGKIKKTNRLKRITAMWKKEKDTWQPSVKQPVVESLKRPAAAENTAKKKPRTGSAAKEKFPAWMLEQTGFGCSKCIQRGHGCAKCNPDKKAFRQRAAAEKLVIKDPRAGTAASGDEDSVGAT